MVDNDSDVTIDFADECDLPDIGKYRIPYNNVGSKDVIQTDEDWDRTVRFVDTHWKFMIFLTSCKSQNPHYKSVYGEHIAKIISDIVHLHNKMNGLHLREIYRNFDKILGYLPCLRTELG